MNVVAFGWVILAAVATVLALSCPALAPARRECGNRAAQGGRER
jgi:hypothetical protein